jgi:NADPH:quinone reductase-like Zn-dependent oxidoreductase
MAQAQKWAVRAYAGPAALELLTAPLPQLRDSDVLVRVCATTATYTDLMILAGTYHPLPPLPCTPGYDLIGVVAAVGARVTTVAVGDRVAAMPQAGCAATHVVLPEKLVLKVRADVAPERAVAVVLTGVTAYQLLHRARGVAPLTAASRLLVHGVGGGTGAMLVKLALIARVPAARIFGTCSVKSMGVARPRHSRV